MFSPDVVTGVTVLEAILQMEATLKLLGEPSRSIKEGDFPPERIRPTGIPRTPRPRKDASERAPYFSEVFFNNSAAYVNASSHVASRNLPSPFSPSRINGTVRRDWLYNKVGASAPLTQRRPLGEVKSG